MTKTTHGATKNYSFLWSYACAWTKWVPSNQFMNAGNAYDAANMTLERFGFIGMDKKCFWGMVGVDWVTPLKVSQVKPGTAPGTAPATEEPKGPSRDFEGGTYTQEDFGNGNTKINGIHNEAENWYLGRLWHKDPSGDRWVKVDLDGGTADFTAQIACKEMGYPSAGAAMYRGNHINTGKCSDNYFGPSDMDPPADVDEYFNANCNKDEADEIGQCKTFTFH